MVTLTPPLNIFSQKWYKLIYQTSFSHQIYTYLMVAFSYYYLVKLVLLHLLIFFQISASLFGKSFNYDLLKVLHSAGWIFWLRASEALGIPRVGRNMEQWPCFTFGLQKPETA